MASDASASSQSMSGLTEKEAQEFHKVFIATFALFTVIALLAHLLVWVWKPWIGVEETAAAVINSPLNVLFG